HQLRNHCKEMGAITPLYTARPHQPDVNLVDHCRGLQRARILLVVEELPGDLFQLGVDERDQSRQRTFVAAPPLQQQPRYFAWNWRAHEIAVNDWLWRLQQRVFPK